jgi:thiamine biosynthesis lipoprotein
VAALACLQAGCTPPPDKTYKTQIFTLGTVVDISFWDVDEARAAAGVKAIERVLDGIHNRWHAWQPSELTRINAGLAAGQAVAIADDEAAALRQAVLLAEKSGELFNPAAGRLIGLWGFHSDNLPTGPPPARDDIDRLLAAGPSMADLSFGPGTVSSANPAVEIDLGGFAKGYGVDRAIEAVRALGITDAVVNAGGDLRAIGSHGRRPWRIGIRLPTQANGVLASVEVRGDECVFTSGNYERYYDYQGRRYHHIIDPRTGYPSAPAVSATVIYPEGAVADAAATALMVAGPEKWRETAGRMGITQVMLIDADMKVYMTPAMAKRIHFEVSPAPEVIVGEPISPEPGR